MKKPTYSTFVVGAVVLLVLGSFGSLVQSTYDHESTVLNEQSIKDCSLCELLHAQVGELPHLLYNTQMIQNQHELENEPWSYYECFDSANGACRFCIQILDHDGNGPQLPEAHYWLYCHGELIWHIWCEDANDPESCVCLDGCETPEVLGNYFLNLVTDIQPIHHSLESFSFDIHDL